MEEKEYAIRLMDDYLRQKILMTFNSLEYKIYGLEGMSANYLSYRNRKSPTFEINMTEIKYDLKALRKAVIRNLYHQEYEDSFLEKSKDEIEEEFFTTLKQIFSFVKREIAHISYYPNNIPDHVMSKETLMDSILESVSLMTKMVPYISTFATKNSVVATLNDINYGRLMGEYKEFETLEQYDVVPKKSKIMLVETDSGIQESLQSMLEITGLYEVYTVKDLSSVMDTLVLSEYDAAIVDTILSGSNQPVEFMKKINKDEKFKDFPVIFLNPIHDRELTSKINSFNSTIIYTSDPFHFRDFLRVVQREVRLFQRMRELKKQLDRYDLLAQVFHNTDIMVMITRGNDKIVYLNQALRSKLKISDYRKHTYQPCWTMKLCQGGNQKCHACSKALMDFKEQKTNIKIKVDGGVMIISELRVIPIEKNEEVYLVKIFSGVTRV